MAGDRRASFLRPAPSQRNQILTGPRAGRDILVVGAARSDDTSAQPPVEPRACQPRLAGAASAADDDGDHDDTHSLSHSQRSPINQLD
jgi:hypothetical protein